MAAVAQATTHTHFIYHFQPPEGKVCTTGDNYEFNSRVGESLQKGITHNVVRGWFVRSINKGGQSFNRYKVTTKRSVILVTSSPWRERKRANFNGEITMEQSTNWESLIAQRMRPCVALKIEDPVKRNIRNKERIKDRTPRRKAQHKSYAQSPAGKKSMSERGKRYRATEKGKENSRKKAKKYFLTHHNDPEWRAHRRELQRAWKARKKAEKQKENEAA